jgi:uncharacterized protein involved in exopolysaccharide biosynthesis
MWNAVYKKLWIVVLVPLVAAGIAFVLTYKKARLYRSVATVQASIPDEPTNAQTIKDIQEQEPDQYYENMVATMKTEVITSMVSYRLLLHDLEKEIAFRPPAIQYSNERKDLIRKTLEKKLASFELLSETVSTEATISQIIHNMDYDVARWIRDGEMSVVRKPQSSEIEVSTSTEDPFLSAFASNALSQEYIRYETAIAAPVPANDSIGYYRQEVDRLRKIMEAKTSEVNEAAQKRSSSPSDDIRFQREKSNRIAEYEMQIKEEEWELNSLRDQLAKVERPEVTEQPRTTDVASNAKIQAARKKIDQLSAIYVEGGSKDRKLDSIINVLRKQVNDETLRLQTTMKSTANKTPASNPERDMLRSRIQRHEQAIASIRNDIRRLRNTTITSADGNNNAAAVTELRKAQESATAEYNSALAHLKDLEASSGVTNSARASHHLVLKAKALPSAEPESPWAVLIVISAFVVTLAAVLIIIAATRPAPTIPDDIFLRVNYANRQRRLNNQQPVTNNTN